MSITRSGSLAAALRDVKAGTDDAAIEQRGSTLMVRYSIADPVTAGVVQAVFASLVQQANQAASGRPPAFSLTTAQVENSR
jgi:ABC-2 type transport system permease protein